MIFGAQKEENPKDFVVIHICSRHERTNKIHCRRTEQGTFQEELQPHKVHFFAIRLQYEAILM